MCVLLDIIDRNIEFSKLYYDELVAFANAYNMDCKQKAFILNSYAEFLGWYNEIIKSDYLYEGENIEGFVLEGKNNFMTKVKLDYYKFWKNLRGVADEVFRKDKNGNFMGYINKTSRLTNAESNQFYGFICNLAKNNYNEKTDIISLRELYETT